MKKFRQIPMLVVMGIIFFLSHQSAGSLALPVVYGLDKVLHLIAYAVLAATVIYAVPPHIFRAHPLQTRMLILAFCLAYGISDEFHQSFVPGREPSIFDVVADVCGAALMLGTVWFLKQEKTA